MLSAGLGTQFEHSWHLAPGGRLVVPGCLVYIHLYDPVADYSNPFRVGCVPWSLATWFPSSLRVAWDFCGTSCPNTLLLQLVAFVSASVSLCLLSMPFGLLGASLGHLTLRSAPLWLPRHRPLLRGCAIESQNSSPKPNISPAWSGLDGGNQDVPPRAEPCRNAISTQTLRLSSRKSWRSGVTCGPLQLLLFFPTIVTSGHF